MIYDPREVADELERRLAEHSREFAAQLQAVIHRPQFYRLLQQCEILPELPNRKERRLQAERVVRAIHELRDSIWGENAKYIRFELGGPTRVATSPTVLQQELQQTLERIEQDTERLADAARLVIEENGPAKKGENAQSAEIIKDMRSLFELYGVPWKLGGEPRTLGDTSLAVLAVSAALKASPRAARRSLIRRR
jgi:hypothetical protein